MRDRFIIACIKTGDVHVKDRNYDDHIAFGAHFEEVADAVELAGLLNKLNASLVGCASKGRISSAEMSKWVCSIIPLDARLALTGHQDDNAKEQIKKLEQMVKALQSLNNDYENEARRSKASAEAALLQRDAALTACDTASRERDVAEAKAKRLEKHLLAGVTERKREIKDREKSEEELNKLEVALERSTLQCDNTKKELEASEAYRIDLCKELDVANKLISQLSDKLAYERTQQAPCSCGCAPVPVAQDVNHFCAKDQARIVELEAANEKLKAKNAEQGLRVAELKTQLFGFLYGKDMSVKSCPHCHTTPYKIYKSPTGTFACEHCGSRATTEAVVALQIEKLQDLITKLDADNACSTLYTAEGALKQLKAYDELSKTADAQRRSFEQQIEELKAKLAALHDEHNQQRLASAKEIGKLRADELTRDKKLDLALDCNKRLAKERDNLFERVVELERKYDDAVNQQDSLKIALADKSALCEQQSTHIAALSKEIKECGECQANVDYDEVVKERDQLKKDLVERAAMLDNMYKDWAKVASSYKASQLLLLETTADRDRLRKEQETLRCDYAGLADRANKLRIEHEALKAAQPPCKQHLEILSTLQQAMADVKRTIEKLERNGKEG